jgi:hypothetical protein
VVILVGLEFAVVKEAGLVSFQELASAINKERVARLAKLLVGASAELVRREAS